MGIVSADNSMCENAMCPNKEPRNQARSSVYTTSSNRLWNSVDSIILCLPKK